MESEVMGQNFGLPTATKDKTARYAGGHLKSKNFGSRIFVEIVFEVIRNSRWKKLKQISWIPPIDQPVRLWSGPQAYVPILALLGQIWYKF